MKRNALIVFVFIFGVLSFTPVLSQEKRDMGGWEKDGPYNKHYNAGDMDSYKGWVVDIKEVIPLPGMSPGVAVQIRDSKDRDAEIITVHLGPRWFVDPKRIGIKKGDRVRVNGVFAEIGGVEVLMAAKIKKENFFEHKVRLTKDGTPFWTMSPGELAKERAANPSSLKDDR